MNAGVVYAELAVEPNVVSVERRGELPEPFWRAVSRIFGNPDVTRTSLQLPLSSFLAQRNRFRAAVDSYGGRVEFGPELRLRLQEALEEGVLLDSAIVGKLEPGNTDEVVAELSATRFTRTLMEFQSRDLAKLAQLPHGANFSVPGAGKTTVGFALYELERHRGNVDRLLVVAPLSAFESWIVEAVDCLEPPPVVAEFVDWAPLDAEVLIVNYQRLASGAEKLRRWMEDGRTHLILDEAHRMKRGRDGEWGRACLDLAHSASRRDVLTGTPAPNHPSDLSALFEFLWPFDVSRVLPRGINAATPDEQTMEEISTRISPLFARTNKSELGLREPNKHAELVPMKPVQREIYDALRLRAMRKALSAPDQLRMQRVGEVTMYLIQAASNPGLLARALTEDEVAMAGLQWPAVEPGLDASVLDKVREYGQIEIPAKFEKLATLVSANSRQGRKTLVWSNFVGNLRMLHRELLAPFEPALIYGGVPMTSGDPSIPSRASELNRFREDDDCMVLLANPAAMSEGVSLHKTCNDAIYVDRTFNAGQYLQSLDRIHRLGLDPDIKTNFTFLITRDSIDEVIDSRIRLKVERLGEVMADERLREMALPDEDAYGEWIDTADADEILHHLLNAR